MNNDLVFWNVDTQYDFMRPDGKLYVPGAESLEGNLEKLTNHARLKGIRTVNSKDWHNVNSKEFSSTPDFVNTFPPHCLARTKGAEYVPATAVRSSYNIDWDRMGFNEALLLREREIVIRKDAFDVFTGNPNTDRIVQVLSPKTAIVYGVATNFCVDYAVEGLAKRGIQVYAVKDAIREIPLANEPQRTFDKWEKLGVKFTTTDEVIGKYK